MEENLYEYARAFFEEIQSRPIGKRELSRFNRTLRFESTDGKSFQIEVNNGQLTMREGPVNTPFDANRELLIKADADTFLSIFKSQTSIMDVGNRISVSSPGKTSLPSWFYRLIYIGQQKVISPNSIFARKKMID